MPKGLYAGRAAAGMWVTQKTTNSQMQAKVVTSPPCHGWPRTLMPNRRLGAPDQPSPPQNGSQNLAGSLQPKEPATQGALRLAGQQPSTRWATPTQFCQGVASSFALQGLMSELQPRIVGMMGQARLRAHCWLCMQSAMALPCAVAAACRGGRQRHG